MLLSQILDLNGIESLVLERRSRAYVLSRIRAGVIEQGTMDLLRSSNVGERMDRKGQIHEGIEISFGGRLHRIDFWDLTGGKTVMVYGQTEITHDLYSARDKMNGQIIHEVEDVKLHEIDGDSPYVTYSRKGETFRLDCEFIAGCDGFHGVSRETIPASVLRTYEKIYDFGWLGVLSETKPVASELIYANHDRGFALCSMRSNVLSRYYIQTPLGTDLNKWPDDRFWDELKRRLPEDTSKTLETGPSIEKSIAPLRSFVAEPMSCGRLFLAGDAGHIVPPTGAKGLNLAASDVHYLSTALISYYKDGSEEGLKNYSEKALRRIWKAVRFSWWMTMMLHKFPEEGEFGSKIQHTELNYLFSSRAAMSALAENYVGLPFED